MKGLALTLGVGTAGAFAAATTHLPLPWLLGSLLAVSASTLAGLPATLPPRLRCAFQTVVGCALGAAFTPRLVATAGSLRFTLLLLLAASLLATAVGALFLRSARPAYSPATAWFAAVPGGLNDMTLLAGELGGDERVVALSHTIRLVATVSLLPLALRTFLAAGGAAMPIAAPLVAPAVPLALVPPADAVLLLLCAVLGPWLGKQLRLPARFLIGPLLLSAVLHGTGLTAAAPPVPLLRTAQVVVGAAVGARFAGVRPRDLLSVAGAAAVVTGLQTLVALGAAALAARVTGQSSLELLLAFSPGGITEMTLTASALGLDAAFVATHHLVRILCIISCMPAIFALGPRLQRLLGPKTE